MSKGRLLILIYIIYTLVRLAIVAYLVIKRKKGQKGKGEHFKGFLKTSDDPIIYCLMITGKDDSRIKLARKAVNNFNMQTYPNKKLVILNHSNIHVLQDKTSLNPKGIHEFNIEKERRKLSLGAMRNISLELVAHDALWTTWDDDDWRAPTYLSTMYNELRATGSVCVALGSRHEFNVNNNYAWKSQLKSGFPIVLAKFDRRVIYQDKDTLEDTNIIKDYATHVGKVTVIHPTDIMYVRTVHMNNTSPYVNPNKQTIATTQQFSMYHEMQLSSDETHAIQEIMSDYLLDNN